MSTVKWLESQLISETQRAKYAEGRVRALLMELDKKDAALRRAKVEVLREVKCEALGSRMKCFKFDTLYAEGNDDALNALVKWIDARAAQIEEGE